MIRVPARHGTHHFLEVMRLNGLDPGASPEKKFEHPDARVAAESLIPGFGLAVHLHYGPLSIQLWYRMEIKTAPRLDNLSGQLVRHDLAQQA